MKGPILLAVHDQSGELDVIRRELTSRYGTDYTVICESSPLSALRRLDALRTTPGASVLILFAASEMSEMTGTEFLERAHELHRHAQRVLLLPDDEFVTIELVSGPSHDRAPGGSRLSHFVIKVESLQATMADLAAAGLDVEPPGSPDGTDDFLTTWITDPDGNRISQRPAHRLTAPSPSPTRTRTLDSPHGRAQARSAAWSRAGALGGRCSPPCPGTVLRRRTHQPGRGARTPPVACTG